MPCLKCQRTVYLVRHGAVVGSHAATYVGQLERSLSEEGLRQVLRLRAVLENLPISSIHSSDLSRAMWTAQILGERRDLEFHAYPELREINLGIWEGRSFAEIRRLFPNEFKARGNDFEHWRPPGGESFGDCRDRVLPAWHHILESSPGDVLVVGHASVNRIILSDVLGMPTANIFHIAQDYGCLNAIFYGEAGPQLKLLNYTPWGVPQPTDLKRAEEQLAFAD